MPQTLRRLPASSIALGLAVTVAAAVVYQPVIGAYFFNDDFQWLLAARSFDWASWLNPAAHTHFFRPLPELYFHLARLAWDRSAPAYHFGSILLHCLNALLVWLVAARLGGRRPLAIAGLCLIVQPGAVEAVSWPCAVSTVFTGTFFLAATLFHLRFLESRGRVWALLAFAAFAACLASHESSVVLLPLLYLVECVHAKRLCAPWERDGRSFVITKYIPHTVLLAAYLAAEYVVNARNYVIIEGHYAFGLHVFPHLIDYVIALHLGQHTLMVRIAVVATTALLLVLGSARVRLYTLWIWLTLLPGSFFTWENVGRYEYLAAIGLSLLVAEGVVFVGSKPGRRLRRRRAAAVAVLIMALVVVRSAAFARKGADTFRRAAEPFRTFVAAVEREQLSRPTGRIETAVPAPPGLSPMFLEAAVRLAYDDPSLTLVFVPRGR